MLIGCSDKSIPQKGDLITWKQNPQLVIKTEISARRQLVKHEKDSPFNHPELERYVGQFPINYVPNKYPLITASEVETLENPTAGYQTQFDLALNGARFKSTDKDIYSDSSLDHIDQVKISIFNRSDKKTTENYINKESRQSDFLFSKKYNLDCYVVNLRNNNSAIQCYGLSKTKKTPSIIVQSFSKNTALVKSYNPDLGIYVAWRINKKNLYKWQGINDNIWHIINTWNVSPFNTQNH